jgi:hypothetical protein
MSRLPLRAALLVLAFVHSFPARKHLLAFVAAPSLEEAWKGIGAACAIALYLAPIAWHVRALGFLWSRARFVLALGGVALALAHAVPALDHLPRLVAEPSLADAWRGLGSFAAFVWFLLPLPVQGRALAFSLLRRRYEMRFPTLRRRPLLRA